MGNLSVGIEMGKEAQKEHQQTGYEGRLEDGI